MVRAGASREVAGTAVGTLVDHHEVAATLTASKQARQRIASPPSGALGRVPRQTLRNPLADAFVLLVLTTLYRAPQRVRNDPQRFIGVGHPLRRIVQDGTSLLAVAGRPHPAGATPDDQTAKSVAVQKTDAALTVAGDGAMY